MANTPLPAPVELTTGPIAKMQADHHETATRLERVIERLAVLPGRPRTVGVMTAVIVGWMPVNTLAHLTDNS